MSEISITAKLLYCGTGHDTITVGELRTFVAQLNDADPEDELTVSTSVDGAAFTIEGHVELIEPDIIDAGVHTDQSIEAREQESFTAGFDSGYRKGYGDGSGNGS